MGSTADGPIFVEAMALAW